MPQGQITLKLWIKMLILRNTMCRELHVQILSYISPQNALNDATSSCSKEQTMSNILHSQKQIFQITAWIHIIYNEINS